MIADVPLISTVCETLFSVVAGKIEPVHGRLSGSKVIC
jgi:hypothetical protein